MTEKRTNLTQAGQASTYCSLTGVQVLEYASKRFAIADWHVTWWNCPACGGWHILTTKTGQEKDGVKVEPVFGV
ncbi:MAG: hypothetical protein U0401_21400 [Anaerolineae bacterium]